ncbi:MAG: metallophosphoesterase [Bacilli bacterium]
MKYIIIKKYYSSEDNLFHVIKKDQNDFFAEEVENTYEDFKSFYKAVNKNLYDTNLLGYHFDDIDPKKFDLSGAKVSAKTMIKLGKYSDKIEKVLKKDSKLSIITPMTTEDLIPSRQSYDAIETAEEYDENEVFILYISDLHINHKLIKKFKKEVNEYEIDEYLKSIVLKLKDTIPEYSYDRKVIIIGDTSYSFKMFKKFFTIYKENIDLSTFVILGNHELWDKTLIKKCGSIEKMVEVYRDFLDTLNINLLENELYIPNCGNDDEYDILDAEQILSLDTEKLREIFLHNSYAILGGIGYAGLNEDFNYNSGIYREANISREDEIKRSKLFESLHRKLANIIPDKKLYVASHMSKVDWTTDRYVPNWVYLSGHTHKNYYFVNDEASFYSDNQIGYYNNSFGFKYISTSPYYNIFEDAEDGLYEITRECYLSFYRGIGESINFNRPFKNLLMIKRENSYCFLMEGENDRLYFLSGGQIYGVKKNGLEYYYENLSNYSNSIKLLLNSYFNFQKEVSKTIKKIGGDGHIHGSIVDIDCYNHLYINPLDGTVTPYFANSITDKYIYRNLISLLKDKLPEMYLQYKSLLMKNANSESDKKFNLPTSRNELIESKDTTFDDSTEMYRVSRILKGLQFTTKFNVVRVWNYTMASNCSTEVGRLFVSEIIDSKDIKA